MTDKVYIVTQGSYSDYKVICACPSKRIAQRAAKRYNQLEGITSYSSEKFRAEELDWITNPDEDIVLRTVYHVEINNNGEVERQHEFSFASPGSINDGEYKEDSANPAWRVHGTVIVGNSLRGYDVALKVARDKLAEMKARNEGLE